MLHVHGMNIRPDVITRTGVIQPYSLQEIPPLAVARNAVRAFETVARSPGPQVRTEMQPEEFAARARRIAEAMSAGKRVPRGTSSKLIHAARLIIDGKPFAVRSAGRVANVQASPATRVVNRKRPVAAKVRGGVVRDRKGKPVSIRAHRQAGGYWSIFQR